MRSALPLLIIFLVATSTPVAQAQETDEQAQAQDEAARVRFEEAMGLLSEDRFAEARDILRLVLEDAPRSWVAFNLAMALRGTGDVLGAVALLEGILGGQYGRFEGQWGDSATRELDQIRGHIAHIIVTACGAETSTLRINGDSVAELRACETRSFDVNPGRHVLLFDADNADTIEQTLVLERGQTQSARVDLVVREVLAPPPESRSVLRSGWFWGVAGVVVAGAVLGAVIAAKTSRIRESPDNVIFALSPSL